MISELAAESHLSNLYNPIKAQDPVCGPTVGTPFHLCIQIYSNFIAMCFCINNLSTEGCPEMLSLWFLSMLDDGQAKRAKPAARESPGGDGGGAERTPGPE